MRSTWLPGGTVSAIWGKFQNYIDIDQLQSDEKSRENMIRLQNGKISITIVTLYRMPNTSTTSIHTSRVQ